jgi:hypothetical protein
VCTYLLPETLGATLEHGESALDLS